ncbi:hypothetical protein [Actinoplanes auranticolor]|uniref:Uncharacterized protein n=1 Tax=Actinoplanes auranticolor TaxID=47988 RepID=A0A919VQD7_9ACTN|nr:hypothetical protein [Actinoplanes auranticolor]GIM65348.1 hypothetical protein Aau02nite_16430 [Actinoplanes auranticolor]
MRSRLIAVGATAALLLLTGCTDKKDETAAPPPVQVVQQPAASAGGACILWDYAFIEQKIGVAFSIAASDQIDDTSTCVVQTDSADWPDLALSVVESTKADAELFTEELMPKKATKLKGLGKAGYRLVTKASGGHGPTVEIGWLSEAEQLQTLRFTFPADAPSEAVDDLAPKLLDLAKAMDTTDG